MEIESGFLELEIEDFPNEFQCCVCLDLMYKPVVLACGHISCFWCVFRAMDTCRESYCPVCRNSYVHFPRVCQLLHFMLLKLYPSAYRRREKQVAEEEKMYGHAAPRFDDNTIDPHLHKVIDQDTSPLMKDSLVKSGATYEEDYLLTQDFLEGNCRGKENVQITPKPLDCLTTCNISKSESHTTVPYEDRNETLKQVASSLLECSICKKLLYRPVVLNCGHAYCEVCINNPKDDICRCPYCQCAHPNGFPSVCLILNQFLEMHFPEEYATRVTSLIEFHQSSPSCSTEQMQKHAGKYSKEHSKKLSTGPCNDYLSWLSSLASGGPKVHLGVGCDYCGMCPITGLRYKCKDCVEKIGFDLCEGCYNSSSKLPGRFNQQHTPEHEFAVIKPKYPRDLILHLGAEYYAEHDEYDISVDYPDNLEVVFTMPGYSNEASEDEIETAPSLDLLGRGPNDTPEEMASPGPLHDASENQADDSSA